MDDTTRNTGSAGRTGLEVRLAARPEGLPGPGDFEIAEAAVADPAPGEVLVRNLYMSLDPGMLGLIAGDGSMPMPRYEVGEVMYGNAVGEVVASADPAFGEGDLAVHPFGWREFAVGPAARFRRVERDAYASPSAHLGFGFVAWVGLVEVARLQPGETVFVSSAAGATGSMAGQIARLKGAARVVGSAGSPAKAALLTRELGYDAAFDYHRGPVVERLREAAPDGIDVYFDNTGGEQLRAAIEVMNPHGRIALCGALGRQSAGGSDEGPGSLLGAIGKRLTLRGFTVGDHMGGAAEFGARMRAWSRAGRIVHHESVVEGLENAPRGLLDLIGGAFTGKTVVRLAR